MVQVTISPAKTKSQHEKSFHDESHATELEDNDGVEVELKPQEFDE